MDVREDRKTHHLLDALRSFVVFVGKLPRTLETSFARPTFSVGPASCTLLAGLSALVIAFLPGQPYRLEQFDLPKDIALGVLGVLSALLLLWSRGPIKEERVACTLTLFLGWGLMATPLVAVNHVVAWRTIGLFAAATSVFMLSRRVGAVGGAPVIYGGATLIIGLMCALVLLEAYGGIPFISAPGRRPGATLGNRNLAARLACMALPFLWMRIVGNDRRAVQCVLLTVITEASAVIVLSRSRGALLVACCQVALLPTVTRWCSTVDTFQRWRTATKLWAVGLVFGSLLVVLLPNRLGWSAVDFAGTAGRIAQYQSGTGRGRLIQLATTWRIIRHHPLVGVGPGNWSVVYPAYAPTDDPSVVPGAFYPGPQVPRNDVLPLVAEWGFLGTALGVAFLVVLVARMVRLLAGRREGARMNGVLVLALLLSAMMLELFDSILRIAPTVGLLAVLLGVALGEGETELGLCRADRTQLSPSWKWLRGTWGVYAVLSLAFARSAMQDFRALRIINSFTSANDLVRAVTIAPNNVEAGGMLSYVLVSAGRCDLAMPLLDRAAGLQPYSLFFTRLRHQCSQISNVAPDSPAKVPNLRKEMHHNRDGGAYAAARHLAKVK